MEGAAPAAPAAKLKDAPNLDAMSHAELPALAEKEGVDVKKSDSKAVIAAAIKAKR